MLIKYLLKRWYLVVIYVAIVIAAPIVNVNAAYVSGDMLDYASDGDYDMFVNRLLVFLLYFVAHGLLIFIMHTLRAKIVSGCRRDVRMDMLQNIISANNEFFSKTDEGLHIAAFSNDITILENKFFEAWLVILENAFSIVTAVIAGLNLHKHLAAIILIGEVFVIVVCYVVKGYSMKKNQFYIEKLAMFTQRVKDYCSSFHMIRNYSVEEQVKKRFNSINDKTEEAKDDADMALAFVNRLGNMSISLIKFIMVGYGLTLVIRGKMTMGIIFTAFNVSDQLVGPTNSFLNSYNSIQAVQSIVNRIKRIAVASEKEKEQENLQIDGPVTLSLDNVCVEINGKKILKNITQTFEPGKKYLIIGRNGAGKTTLLKLIKRSTDEYEGSISINEHNIRGLSYEALSKKISYINEFVPLLCASVRDNIKLYRDISEEQLQEAVDSVGLSVELDRVVKDGERNLSSGETRRIEIARSLIGKSNIIVYDEAISTLDIPTAHEIEKTLLSLKEQTVLFVSHNFSSKLIRQYDEIILLDQGSICGRGNHDQLMESSEYYRHIMSIKNG